MSRLTEVLARYHELGIEEQLNYDRLYRYSIITHSTAIEGSTVTEIENQLLFDEGIGSNRPIYEQWMNLDLKNAYEQGERMAREHRILTPEVLCALSALVMKNTGSDYNTMFGAFSSSNGDLRLINVSAGRGGKSYLAWQKIPDRLEKLCAWLNSRREQLTPDRIDQVYDLSFEAHYRLVTIHPWADGNGRMSRLLMNMIQMEFGAVPSIVKKESRVAYVTSLAEARDRDDAAVFLNFMREHHIQNIEEQIADYLHSQNETLNRENETINETLNLSAKEKRLLSLLQEDPFLTVSGMKEISGYSRSTINRMLSRMQEHGLVRRAGSKKTGHWEVVRSAEI